MLGVFIAGCVLLFAAFVCCSYCQKMDTVASGASTCNETDAKLPPSHNAATENVTLKVSYAEQGRRYSTAEMTMPVRADVQEYVVVCCACAH